jgi:ribonuclease R
LTPPSDLPGLKRIRNALQQSPRGPLKPKELARALDVPRERYVRFKKLLRTLEERGELYRNRKNRYAIPEKINLVVGTLRFTRAGDAFLRPDHAEDGEVFVPSGNLDSAMDGDRVAVRIESRPRGRAPVGQMVKVLERAHPTLVGVYHSSGPFGFVRPTDRRVSRDVLIPQGAEGGARDGEVAVVRIKQYGSSRQNAVGEVEAVLGRIDEPGVDVLAVLHGHGLPSAFPPEVEKAARSAEELARNPGPRTDCRELLVFTIDPPDAKDHDDALSVTAVEKGVWEVGIHIADVSHFVREDSPLDLEAYQRGTSVYLVDQVVPMLPHSLSSDLCSLREGEDRLAVSLFVILDESGRVREHRFERTWIRCRHGLDYGRVHRVLEGNETVDPDTDEALRILDRLAGTVRARRRDRGSLDFDLPEARVVLDEDGSPVDIRKVVQLDSHRLIEDFMVLANEVVAREAESRLLPIPFRVHDPPQESSIEELRTFLASVGHSLPRGKVDGRVLQGVLDRVRGRPEESLISTVILRSMTRARYDPRNVGHFGLASEAYAHFTSPIRRYPDLLVHRALTRALVDGKSIPERWGGERLADTAEWVSERERVAQRAERDSVEMKKIEFMRRHLGEEFPGTIAGVTSFGFFVLLDRYFVEGLVHVSTLEDDYYRFLPEAYSLVGERGKRRFRLGDRVRVQVARADKEQREIDFMLRDHG